MRERTLKQSLVLIVAATLLPIAILIVAQGLSSRELARELIGERLVANALGASAEERDVFNIAQATLDSYARNDNVIDMTAECTDELTRGLAVQNAILNIVRVDRNGRPVCAVFPYDSAINFAREPWWKSGIAAHRFTISDPVIGQTSQRPALIAMTPLFDGTGGFAGAITAEIDLSWLERSLKMRRLSPQAITLVTDSKGNIILPSDRMGIDRITLPKVGGKSSLLKVDGSSWMFAAAPLYERQLFVVYAERQSALMSAARDQMMMGMILPVAAIIFASLAVWWATHRLVVNWLRKVASLARRLARGDYATDPVTFVGAPTEIRELGDDLQAMAAEIRERDANLRQAADEAHALAREVNHRTKNNLQVVLSLVSLQIGKSGNPEATYALEMMKARVNAIALIHRLAYESDNDSDRGSVDMNMLVPQLCHSLGSNFGDAQHHFECHSHMGRITLDQALPLALFVVEGVTNAYQHAYPPGKSGRIEVMLDRIGSEGIATIRDEGIGYEPAGGRAAMGLDLMQALAIQLSSTVQTEAVPGKGVIISLRFLIES